MDIFRKAEANKKGFTLLEILIVIGIIAILATVVLIALNPARQFAQARNSQRVSNVNTILNGIGQYIADNKGEIPSEITTASTSISVGLCGKLMPTYIASLPSDPNSALKGESINNCGDITTIGDVDYLVSKDANNRVTVSIDPANKELDADISVTR